MNSITSQDNTTVLYSGDETNFRRKKFGYSLIDQVILSVQSLRQNWSLTVPVYFVHTRELTQQTVQRFKSLNIKPILAGRHIEPKFPMANKLLVGDVRTNTEFNIFVDCDTYFHAPVQVDMNGFDIGIAYDALQTLPAEHMMEICLLLDIPLIHGTIVESPEYEYYIHDRTDIIPAFNSGVILFRSSIRNEFFTEWEHAFHALFAKYRTSSWEFYIEQAACAITIASGQLPFRLLPKGYNFICTPRAPFLADWPQDKIVIEHYAGDTSRPIKLAASN